MPPQRQFRYNTLLRVRERQEELKAQVLAVARREVAVAQAQLAQLADAQHRTLERAGMLARDCFDASEVRTCYQYERHLAQLGDAKEAEIGELQAHAEERRCELLEATKRKRVIEKLKQRRWDTYQKHRRDIEQRAADESATNCAAINARQPADQRLDTIKKGKCTP